jgi:hypothetical protein
MTMGTFRPDKATTVTAVNKRPDANQLSVINSRRVQLHLFAAANAERMRQLTDDSTRLLQIATELNSELTEVDKADVPAAAATKADMIEQLAHAVKEKMKLTVAVQ